MSTDEVDVHDSHTGKGGGAEDETSSSHVEQPTVTPSAMVGSPSVAEALMKKPTTTTTTPNSRFGGRRMSLQERKNFFATAGAIDSSAVPSSQPSTAVPTASTTTASTVTTAGTTMVELSVVDPAMLATTTTTTTNTTSATIENTTHSATVSSTTSTTATADHPSGSVSTSEPTTGRDSEVAEDNHYHYPPPRPNSLNHREVVPAVSPEFPATPLSISPMAGKGITLRTASNDVGDFGEVYVPPPSATNLKYLPVDMLTTPNVKNSIARSILQNSLTQGILVIKHGKCFLLCCFSSILK